MFHVQKGEKFLIEWERDLTEIMNALRDKNGNSDLTKGSQAEALCYLYGQSKSIKDSPFVDAVGKEYVNAYFNTK